jgi:hypothetical protein
VTPAGQPSAGPAGRVLAGGGLALLLDRAVRSCPPGGAERWRRTNHRGRTVTLLPGPVLAVAAAAASRSPLPAALAGLGAATVGAYDDAVGSRPAQRSAKGLRGHAAALAQGRVTAGIVKVGGIGASAIAAAWLSGRRHPFDLLLDGALVAGCANLLNLLDLRPGRALKAGLVTAVVLGEPGPAAAAAVLLPDDLAERSMLGDSGANGLGAVLGLSLANRLGDRRRRAAGLAVVVGLTAASEVVSYSAVIDAVPPLRALDRLGRQPDAR